MSRHLFVLDLDGNLLHDIVLGEGDVYHPGGIDTDGTSVWVPVAEYRPNSASIIYRVDATTLEVEQVFETEDRIGGIVLQLWAAPDDGEESAGTELLVFEAVLPGA